MEKKAPGSHETPLGRNTPESKLDRGLGVSGDILLLDEKAVKKDTALIRRALNEGWPLQRKKKRTLVNRLIAITEKEAVLVEWGTGEEKTLMPVDGPADVNAIAAARVLVQMMGQNQADRHHADDLEKPDGGVNVNVGIASTGPVQIYIPDNSRDT